METPCEWWASKKVNPSQHQRSATAYEIKLDSGEKVKDKMVWLGAPDATASNCKSTVWNDFTKWGQAASGKVFTKASSLGIKGMLLHRRAGRFIASEGHVGYHYKLDHV